MHLLLKKAFIYDLPRKSPEINDGFYDEKKGYWVLDESQMPVVSDKQRPKPQTKKADVETGEDRKGE